MVQSSVIQCSVGWCVPETMVASSALGGITVTTSSSNRVHTGSGFSPFSADRAGCLSLDADRAISLLLFAGRMAWIGVVSLSHLTMAV